MQYNTSLYVIHRFNTLSLTKLAELEALGYKLIINNNNKYNL